MADSNEKHQATADTTTSPPPPSQPQQPKKAEQEHDSHLESLFKRGPVSPEKTAWLPSRMTLWWLNDMFKKGYKRQIEEDDLYEMLDQNKSAALAGRLAAGWEAEKARALAKGRTPSLVRATFATFWGQYYTCVIAMEFGDLCQICNPLILQQIILFVQRSSGLDPPAVWQGYALAIALMIITIAQNMFYQHWNVGSVKMGLFLRAALIDLVFRKATVLSSRSHLIYPDGAIVNLMSTDTSRIDTALFSLLIVVSVPIFSFIVVGLLIHLMGPSAILGAAILIFVNPIQGWAMAKLTPIRKRASQFTDSRIRLTTEVLQGIKVIKFFAWEN
ncbi:hypothetical protein BGZ94_004354, partial [Podila epigama]